MRTSLEVLSVEALDEDIVVRETARRTLQSRKDFVAKFEQCLPNLSDETVIALAHDGSRGIRAIIARSERTSLESFLGEWDSLVLAELCMRVFRDEEAHQVEILQNLHKKQESNLDPAWQTLLTRIKDFPRQQDLEDAKRAALLVRAANQRTYLSYGQVSAAIEHSDFSRPRVRQALLQHGCLRVGDFEHLTESETLEYAKKHYRKMALKDMPLPNSGDFMVFLEEAVGTETDPLVLDALLGFDDIVDKAIAHNPHTPLNSLKSRKMLVPDIERIAGDEPPVRSERSTKFLGKPYPILSGDHL
jgi:hypothetical protein